MGGLLGRGSRRRCKTRFETRGSWGLGAGPRLFVELLVEVGDEVLVGLEALLCFDQLLLQSLVNLLYVADLHLGQLGLLQTSDGLPLELVNLIGFFGEALLQLRDLVLLGLVLLTDFLALGI